MVDLLQGVDDNLQALVDLLQQNMDDVFLQGVVDNNLHTVFDVTGMILTVIEDELGR